MATGATQTGRRRLPLSRRLLVAGAFLRGLLFMLSAMVNFVDRGDLTEVQGPVRTIEPKRYWEETVLYVQLENVPGRFKYESEDPGFAEFEAALFKGTPARLWVETASLELEQPAAVFAAEIDGRPVVRFDETQSLHNRETWLVFLAGPVFWFLGIWIWHRATRRLPTAEELAARSARIERLAEKHTFLFPAVHVVTKVRQWGEEIPKVGDLFTAFLFFWILPLYMVFVYVTAQSYRGFVAVFCYSYWGLLVVLPVAALAVRDFPGADAYPALGPALSRVTSAYILLNIAYGGAMWLWGTLMDEPDAPAESTAAR